MSTPSVSDSLLDFDTLSLVCPALTPAHDAWRARVRGFVNTEIAPSLGLWEQAGCCPDSLFAKAADAGILGTSFPSAVGGEGEADLYYRIIMSEEMHRLGTGLVFADLATHWIALPPVISHGSAEMLERVVRPVLRGEKRIALAVTEPSGGSDVSRLQTRAVRRGDHYRLHGEKTLISGGMRADFFLTAVRTGDDGMRGISLLLVEADSERLHRHAVEGMGWYNANLAHLRFDDMPVSSANLIGVENQGFAPLAKQFNVERFSGVAATLALSRVCLGEAISWARQRETFGEPLIHRQVVRHTLVELVQELRVAQSYLYHCAARFEAGAAPVADLAMLKIQACHTLENCAREAMQILGGAAYTGRNRVEHMYREARSLALGGGAEAVLKDMVSRQLGF